MITKLHYANSGTWAISATESSKKLAGPCEVTALKLVSTGGPAFVSIYDAMDASGATPANRKWILEASTTDNDNDHFVGPLNFTSGVFAVCEDGAAFNPFVCIAVSK